MPSKFKFLRVVSSALVICLMLVPLIAQSDTSASLIVKNNTDSPPPLSGILDASNPDDVYINGNQAKNGMTILSGSNLETANSDMIISLRDLGKIKVCSQSKLNLTFTNRQVDVKLTNGSLRLDTMPGIGGKITTPQNDLLLTDGNGIVITPNYAAGCNLLGAAQLSAPAAGISFLGPFSAAVGVIGGAVTIAAITSNLNGDPAFNSISVVQP